ncbi:DNA cytosine methyltransferase [Pedobacter sp. PLR]|uniref:DNA cytosine methyltransferase n=1 Tax=Pedobacter sp. PLR TaxID=2994465 RepID=UPI002245EBBF|nr:DNA cytosine methyltransferase [Pedobacter sp. PLR]MCX2452626.1 DNA cytosine methyltransferase [Pedobacter sp. PLR]
MQEIIKSIEEKLAELAEAYQPEGSEIKAVIHQWIHAIAFNHNLFGEERGVDKEKIITCLKDAGLYKNQELFKAQVTDAIHLKQPSSKDDKGFTFIDLFAGIGGMRQGFEKAGGKCVFSSEFEKNAQKTYEQNYGEYPFGDITKIKVEDIPDHDVLVGGFPCQPFSHAGKKLGIEDTRGTLFHNIATIIHHKRPKAVVLENVKGLISHDKGYTLQVVLTTLINEGYTCAIPDEIILGDNILKLQKEAKKMVMKSREFGVPQNRQRIYIVLWRNDLPVSFKYPEPTLFETSVGQILEANVAESFTISDKLWAGHQNRKVKNKEAGKGFGFGLVKHDTVYTNTISARYYKDGGEILIHQDDANPRKLTPREAARLQGFPDNFLINKSNTQAYKQFGNSVTVPVVHAVAANIREQILELNA